MRKSAYFIFLLFIISLFQIIDSSSKHNVIQNRNILPHFAEDPNLNKLRHFKNNTLIVDAYTEWSKWGRCINCIQKRIKKCIHESCHNSKMYEEKECNKKRRCKRKQRKLTSFHVVQLNASRSYLQTKQAPSEIWSKWSKWVKCSKNCQTYRHRNCKKPGRCRKQIQTEDAYCYNEETTCEEYVLNLIADNHQKPYYVDKKYQYIYYNNQYIAREYKVKNEQCGLTFSKPKMLKIIGGDEAEKYKWPWHAAILNQFYEVFCGGTLIAPKWVLTASHCIRKQVRVRFFAHDLRYKDARDIEMKVYQIYSHPGFEISTVENDIALLLLPRSVRVPVACLPTKKPKVGQLCSVMGWGKINTSDLYGVNILHEAKLPLVSHRKCRKAYKEFLISSNMMCAGWKSGKTDTCAGDSGGGLMCANNRKKFFSIQGITSFGDGCGGKNKYGIYTAVYNYLDWINYTMDLYS